MTSLHSATEATTSPELGHVDPTPEWLRVLLVLLVVLGVLAMHALVTSTHGDAMMHESDTAHHEASSAIDAHRLEGDASRQMVHLVDLCILMLSAGLGTAWLVLARVSRVSRQASRLGRWYLRVPSLPGPAPPPGWSHLELAVVLR